MNSRTSSSTVLQTVSSSTTLSTSSTSTLTTTTTTTTQLINQNTAQFKVSLEVPLMKPEQLYPTPSMKDNLPFDVEFDLRLIGCELIQTSGRLLKLPQTAMATGQVLFHRFYYSKSFVKNQMEYYAMAAIFLSSKIEECPRRIRDVLNVFHHIKQVKSGKVIKPMSIDENYQNAKNQVIKAERRLLKELGFCVHVKHPHKIILIYLQAMECNQERLSQKAWNYMNDGLRTDMFLRYTPEMLACACIFLSARELEIPLPENPPWYTIFGADEESIKAICVRLLHLYTHKTRSLEELERIVNECRDKLEQEKKRSKETTTSATSTIQQVEQSTKSETKTIEAEKIIQDEIKKTSEQIKQISANISAKNLASTTTTTKTYSNTSTIDQIPPIHPNQYYINNSHHAHQMTRHSSFNYNYYHGAHPGQYHMPPEYYGAYNDQGYYNENYYETANLKRNKSASYIVPSHPKDYDDYGHKRYPNEPSLKDRGKSYRSRSRTRTRSRSRSRSHSRKLQDKKNKASKHKSRSRSRSDSADMENRDSKSPNRHKKKKSHHSRHKEETSIERKRDRSRDKEKAKDKDRERTKEKDKERNHHKSSKHSKDRGSGNDPRYVPIYS